jgi:hypothetical protein
VKETEVFNPERGFAPLIDPVEITDPAVVHRHDAWWLFCAAQVAGRPATQLTSARLPPGAPLSSMGWRPIADPHEPTRIALVAGHDRSASWDLLGGRHCPSYVQGVDPRSGRIVERIYYAGAAEFMWGPYAIGYLEWDGFAWIDQPAPVFTATEAWERGSVYEPNLIYADGVWKLWYVAGSNRDDYLVHGYAESPDGRTNWRSRRIFAPAALRLFDFNVIRRPSGYEAVFSRVWVGHGSAPPETGLWWCSSDTPSGTFDEWSTPVQVMTAEDRGWHTGPWKPSLAYGDADPTRMFVFFSGAFSRNDGSPFPFAFTLGCLEIDRPATSPNPSRSRNS